MGAWGSGSFENDDAMDWVAGVHSASDVAKPFERLKTDTDAFEEEGELQLDLTFASQLVAAAEVVAMMMGRKIPPFPEDLAKRIGGAQDVDALLFHQARNAVLHVTRHSELAQLWDENAEGEIENEWLAEITGLIERLNPDLEYVPAMPEFERWDMEDHTALCAFCRRPVEVEDCHTLDVTEHGDIFKSSRSLPLHLKCLNSRLHADTMVIDFRPDPDRPINLDAL
jgi:hypothetical protein